MLAHPKKTPYACRRRLSKKRRRHAVAGIKKNLHTRRRSLYQKNLIHASAGNRKLFFYLFIFKNTGASFRKTAAGTPP
jgi:hypothetical protein